MLARGRGLHHDTCGDYIEQLIHNVRRREKFETSLMSKYDLSRG